MIDDFAKAYLHDELRDARRALLRKLDGLDEYSVRRPASPTGTNLLGLVRHLTLSEARYFGAVFGRPFPRPLPTFDDPAFRNSDHLWVPAEVSRAEVVDGYLQACAHADDTIAQLPVDAAGFVPWWPRPHVKLFNVLVHLVTETNRHLGHADLVREGLDGAVGDSPVPAGQEQRDEWAAHRAVLEQAARDASR